MSNGFVMITGASSGIGKAFAAQFAKKGYDLILVARRKERLQELAEEWTKKGRKCFVLTADLAKKKECRKIMEEVEKLPVKVFINNAGFGDCGSFLETDLSKEMEMIHVNIRAMHSYEADALPDGKTGRGLDSKCCIFCRTPPSRPLYGDLLCNKIVCHKSYACRGT